MKQVFHRFRITIILALCLVILFASAITPWAVKGRKAITSDADAKLEVRKDRFMKLKGLLFGDLIFYPSEDSYDYVFDPDAASILIDGDQEVKIESGKIYTMEPAVGGSGYYDDNDGTTDETDTDDPEDYSDFDSIYSSYVSNYIEDDNGDGFFLNSYHPGGLCYCETYFSTISMMYQNDAETRTTYYNVTNPKPINVVSKENAELEDYVLNVLMGSGKETGWKGNYRYLVFKVPSTIFIFDEEAHIIAQAKQDPTSQDLAVPDNYHSMHESTVASFTDDVEPVPIYLTQYLFEDCGAAINAWRMKVTINILVALVFTALLVLISYLFEKSTRRGAVSSGEKQDGLSADGDPKSSSVTAGAGVLTEESARDLLSQIDLAEQSMGPNGYLEQLRTDIHALAGIEREETTEIPTDTSAGYNIAMPGDPADVQKMPDAPEADAEPIIPAEPEVPAAPDESAEKQGDPETPAMPDDLDAPDDDKK